ncbi:hypothetical protein EE612_025427, partial [Oryza sativa]
GFCRWWVSSLLMGAMCGCGNGRTTALLAAKAEWGLMSVTVTSSLSAECSPSLRFPPLAGPFSGHGEC